ncbi:MAG: MBL fold metallo-hydrolase [Chloroflexota bacterium]
MAVHLTCFGGAGMIGGNKLLLESGDRALWLDFGTDFRRRSQYYSDLLSPRSSAGLRDPLALRLIPDLGGIYRSDLQPADGARASDGSVSERTRTFDPVNPPPVLLSHAHLDHCGAVSFLSAETPIYASAATAALLKACQDTAAADFEGETAYLVPREQREGLFAATNYRTTPAVARRLAVPDLNASLAAFWLQPAASRGLAGPPPVDWQPGSPIGGLRVRLYPVDHSVPGAVAWAVETDGGWVVYTGDFRRHGARGGETQRFLAEAAKLKPLAVICEGTHPAAEWPSTEAAVYENACHAVSLTDGLVIADFGPRNVERLATFRRVASDNGRRLVVTTRDAHILEALSLAGVVPDPHRSDDLLVYNEPRLTRPLWERAVLERYGDRVVTARQLQADAGDYIVCFSYHDLPELIDVAPSRGTYIHSASESWNEEDRLDLERLRAWLRHFNLRFAGDPASPDGRGFHASGHIDGPGLLDLIETVAPTWVIPVHTIDLRFFRAHVDRRRLLLPAPGRRYQLA